MNYTQIVFTVILVLAGVAVLGIVVYGIVEKYGATNDSK